MASVLFSPIALRGLTLDNRIVVSPMCQYISDDGSANDWHLMHLGSFSLGAAGLVMTEATNVNAVGRISHKCAGLYSDANEAALKRVIDFCRKFGVAKLGIQLGHADARARRSRRRRAASRSSPRRAPGKRWRLRPFRMPRTGTCRAPSPRPNSTRPRPTMCPRCSAPCASATT